MASNNNMLPLYLGIDGGGTKTEAWLGVEQPSSRNREQLLVLGRGSGGPGNVRACGFAAATQNICTAVANAFTAADLPQQPVSSACLSLAGAGRPAEQTQFAQWTQQVGLSARCQIISDVEAVWAAVDSSDQAHHTCDAIALVIGTGSIVWGKGINNRVARCGGWGTILGDEGSGYAISTSALRLACQTADGRATEGNLLKAILRATECDEPQQLIEWTYGTAASRQRIASLSQVVFEQANSSPRVQQLIEVAAQELTEMVIVVASKLSLTNFALVVAGGVAIHQPAYVRLIEQRLRSKNYHPTEIHMVEHPVLGALRIASATSTAIRP